MSITAIVQNNTIKLPPDVHVPDGTSARIIFETAAGRTLAERYAGLIGITDALPEDMAENHDHYLHGAPKK
ncbi:MAG TPA: hypothetical protein VHY22_19185 [Chthoniobacteraceae bacterium]|jgi:hypothetical protein|nr:hypothetical protein [Chthoniobacteraceae bacterium]